MESVKQNESVESITLTNGLSLPLIGLGTWQSPPGQVLEAVYSALKLGYRAIDCAHVYRNEKEIGQAISKYLKSTQSTSRKDLFITSKLWNTYHSSYERVKKNLTNILSELQLEYLDLFLIHWPISFEDSDTELFPMDKLNCKKLSLKCDVNLIELWSHMEKLVDEGLTKSIGVSNFNYDQINRLIKSQPRIMPVVNQIELHPFLQQRQLVTLCNSFNIKIIAYCPLGSSPSRLGSRANVPLNKLNLLKHPVVLEISSKYLVSPAQILIRYHVQRGIATIPKSVSKERIEENINVFNFKLTNDDLNKLHSLELGYRFCRFNIQGMDEHPEYPFEKWPEQKIEE